MDNDVLTAPVVEGNGTETPPQETQTPTQAGSEPQETNTVKVENGNQTPQNTATPRRNASDFYRERREIRELKDTIAAQNRHIEELASFVQEFKKQNAGAAPSKFDVDRFIQQPDVVMRELIDQEVKTLRDELEGFKMNQAKSSLEREKQEALGVLFPKTSNDMPDNPYQRAEANEERAAKIHDILVNYPAIKDMVDSKPLEAAKIIVKLIEDRPVSSPKAIPKSLMGGTARGNPNPGGQKMERNYRTVMDEVKKMRAEEDKNPELRFDKERRAKRSSLIAEAERLVQEQGK